MQELDPDELARRAFPDFYKAADCFNPEFFPEEEANDNSWLRALRICPAPANDVCAALCGPGGNIGGMMAQDMGGPWNV
jgi:hypothetical protein